MNEIQHAQRSQAVPYLEITFLPGVFCLRLRRLRSRVLVVDLTGFYDFYLEHARSHWMSGRKNPLLIGQSMLEVFDAT